MNTNKTRPDLEKLIEDEAQERYPVNETTGDLYTGSKITFKHGARFIWTTHVEPLQAKYNAFDKIYRKALKRLEQSESENQKLREQLKEANDTIKELEKFDER